MLPLGPNINSRFGAVNPSYNIYQQSWVERAFAEDAAGGLEGCLWPPRSYFCSFCGREFRSAQALGGHMNVHRKDRARLKESASSPSTSETLKAEHPHLNLSTATQVRHPHQVDSLVFGSTADNPNPKSGLSSLLLPRFAAQSTQDYLRSKPAVPSCNCFPLAIHQVDVKNYVFPANLYSLIPLQLYKEPELKLGKLESSPKRKADSPRWRDEHEESDHNMNKRRRTGPMPIFHLMESAYSEYDQKKFQDEICKSNSTVDDLDLELRLGDAPKLTKLFASGCLKE